ELKEYGINPLIYDPVADRDLHEYGLKFNNADELVDLDVVILAVAHQEFSSLTLSQIDGFFKKSHNNQKIIIDIKGILDRKEAETQDYKYWRL
ncbi:MAG: UDP binding domain-containing protein, partial [bacterium]